MCVYVCVCVCVCVCERERERERKSERESFCMFVGTLSDYINLFLLFMLIYKN